MDKLEQINEETKKTLLEIFRMVAEPIVEDFKGEIKKRSETYIENLHTETTNIKMALIEKVESIFENVQSEIKTLKEEQRQKVIEIKTEMAHSNEKILTEINKELNKVKSQQQSLLKKMLRYTLVILIILIFILIFIVLRLIYKF